MNNFYAGKRVLITGNTGFKGSWMTQMLLLMGAEVIGAALKPQTEPNLYELLKQEYFIKQYIVDVRDYERLYSIFEAEKPDMVFHLAAQPIVLESYKNPRYTYDVNVMGTVNVCECIRNIDCVSSYVNVTTDKVYLNNEWEFPYRETDCLDGFEPYSNSKSCSELVTASYIRSFFQERQLAVSTCRAGNVIGGGDFSDFRIIPDCYRAAASGKKIAVRNPNSIRPYQHVLEAISFYLMVAKKQVENMLLAGSYNVGPEYSDCLKTWEVCELFCQIWGKHVSWEEKKLDGQMHEANLLRLDTSKAKSKLGWRPVWDAKRAVEEAVQWYRAFFEGEDMQAFTELQIKRYMN